MPTPRIALIGCGYWGKNHARNWSALGALAMVCDPAESGRALAGEIAPEATITEDPSDAFSNPDIDAVVIATPAETHYELAHQAFAAGKHVLVEKPMALTYADAVRIDESAKRYGRILMVGHLLEFHPAITKIKALIADGSMGKIQYIYSNRLNFGKIRTEENALWSFAPHDIALIHRLTGAVPFEVTCTGGSYITPNLADVSISNLHFVNGVRAHIFVNWLNPFKEQKLVVIGDKKMAVFNDTEPVEKLVVYNQHVEFNGRVPVLEKAEKDVIELPQAEPLRTQCEAFLKAITEGSQPLTDGSSGIEVMRVLEASQLSLQSNGRPVATRDIQR
jgi:predicted dehydrogenase